MKKLLVVLMLLLLIYGNKSIAFQNNATAGNIFYVGGNGPGNYTSIQAAIDAAQPGDKIVVFPGFYESVKINKSLILEGKEATVSGIEINAGNVSVAGFIIKDCYYAIVIKGNGSEIKNCTILNNSYGIKLEGKNNKICYNKIFKNGFYGLNLEFSEENEIEENEIYRNEWGIYMEHSHRNIISRNIIRDNGEGIVIQTGEENIVKLNHIAYNRKYGIHLCCKSQNNIIFENNFIENKYNAYCYGGANSWDFESRGNFWDDYDGNGSYVIYEKNIDHYPASEPYNISHASYRVYIIYPSENEKVSGKIMVKGIAEKEEEVMIKIDNGTWAGAHGTFLWYFEIDTTKLENGEHTIYVKCGNTMAERKIYVENKKETPSFDFVMLLLALLLAKNFIDDFQLYS